MQDVIVGLLAIAIGALFCFRGWLMMRLIIPVWGGFAGFMLGAGLVASLAEESFLGTVLGWVVGAAVAVLFAAFAYLYYEVSVVIAMGAIGFSLATTLLVAMGVTWSWLVILAGVALGTVLALIAIVGNLPMVILTVLSAFGGAGAVVAGAMLLFGVVDLAEFGSAATTERLDDDWWWYLAYVGLGAFGIAAQVRLVGGLSRSMRQSWVDEGGRELRTA